MFGIRRTPWTFENLFGVVIHRSAGRPARAYLENDLLRVEFSPDGDIIRIFDKANRRDVLPSGTIANQLQAFEDRPKFWDAWDIDIFYDDKLWLAEPAASIELWNRSRCAGHSDPPPNPEQRVHPTHFAHVWLSAPDFATKIDWRERHILLKVAFPVDILAPQATYEIQWGNVQRPTHRNTSRGLGALRDLRPQMGGFERRRLRCQPTQRLQIRTPTSVTTSYA